MQMPASAFYVAANAANGNGQDTGDRIFTANITLTPGGASTGPKPAIQSTTAYSNGATFENRYRCRFLDNDQRDRLSAEHAYLVG